MHLLTPSEENKSATATYLKQLESGEYAAPAQVLFLSLPNLPTGTKAGATYLLSCYVVHEEIYQHLGN